MADHGGKRRKEDQLTKDQIVDDDDEGEPQGADPGTWMPNPEAIKARRKVHVRRGGQPAEEAPAMEVPAAASGNPFAGVVLSAPAAPANPFAGVSLLAPSSTPAQDAPKASDGAGAEKAENGRAGAHQPSETTAPSTAPAPAPDAAGTATAAGAAPGGFAGGFGALGAGGGNPFASLGGVKPFSGFGSSGGGFGAVAASGTAFGGFGAPGSTPATGAGGTGLGAFTTSSFSFGTGNFPPVATAPLRSAGGAGSAGGAEGAEDEDGAGEEGGEGSGQGMALFGNAAVQPVVSLPEQAKRTGEEEEQVVFSADGVLFEFDSAAKQWRERGKGEFKVNVTGGDNGRQHARMVMRQAANLRLLLNAKVYSGMPLQLMNGNVGVTFGVINAAAPGAEGAGAADAAKPAEEAQAGEAAATTSSDAAQQGAATSPSGVVSTWAVKIKSSDKVQGLHELLSGMRSTAAGVQADDSAV